MELDRRKNLDDGFSQKGRQEGWKRRKATEQTSKAIIAKLSLLGVGAVTQNVILEINSLDRLKILNVTKVKM